MDHLPVQATGAVSLTAATLVLASSRQSALRYPLACGPATHIGVAPHQSTFVGALHVPESGYP